MKSEMNVDRVLGAINDPARRRILQALKEAHKRIPAVQKPSQQPRPGPAMAGNALAGASLCAGDIQAQLRLSQPTISHHMTVLTEAGLVEAVKQGQWRWYRRNEKFIRRFLKSLRTQL